MISQHSHCARNYSLRGWMVSHPCGTHSTAMRGAVKVQGLQADPAPPGDILSWRFHDGSSDGQKGFHCTRVGERLFLPPLVGCDTRGSPPSAKPLLQWNSSALLEGTMGKCVCTHILSHLLPTFLLSHTQHCSKKGFLSHSSLNSVWIPFFSCKDFFPCFIICPFLVLLSFFSLSN